MNSGIEYEKQMVSNYFKTKNIIPLRDYVFIYTQKLRSKNNKYQTKLTPKYIDLALVKYAKKFYASAKEFTFGTFFSFVVKSGFLDM